jgi:6-phosphogluconolactonase
VDVSVQADRSSEALVYVGTYTGHGSDGIYAWRFNLATGETVSVGLVGTTPNPSFLAIDSTRRFLYAVNEVDTFQGRPTGAVSVFAIEQRSGQLQPLQQVSSLGGGPAYVSLDRSGRYLMVANYMGGNYAVFPIGADGRLGAHTAFVQDVGASVHPERQTGPHAHSIRVTTDNRLAIVADLGLDKLLLYRFDDTAGALRPAHSASVATTAGSGPRHMAFAPSGRFVYVVNELTSTVTVFLYHSGAGTLRVIQTIAALPADFRDFNTAAEIAVDARGRFLYVSNRGHDSIAVFSIDAEHGTLVPVEWVSTAGRTPRHFAIDPTDRWLLAANQNSHEITLFQIDTDTGRLTPTGRSFAIVSPVCVQFAR